MKKKDNNICSCGRRKNLEFIGRIFVIPWLISWIGIFVYPLPFFTIWIVSFIIINIFGHEDMGDTAGVF